MRVSGKHWVLLAAVALFVLTAHAAAADVVPETPYAAIFLEKCDGQQWFIDEVERLLNMKQATLAEIESADDLDVIKSIGLKDQAISGTIPRAVGELHELRYLFLSGNELAAPIPNELFTLLKVENIDLGGNRFAGAIPAEFGAMPALTTLNLRGNSFTGTIPGAILSNTRMTFLDISSNQLTGALPAGINGMTALQYLAVSDNAWGGALPDLSALAGLKTLSAWNCKLTGVIPDSLYTLTDLQVLDLSGNTLTGPISASIGGLAALQLLAIGSNELTGAVPAEIGALTKLQTLDLSDNKLEGTLSDAFSGMTVLREAHIEDNRLRGLIPASLKARYDAGTAVYAQNNCMTGAALKAMAHNAKNFTDGANTEQYQLTARQAAVQIKTDGAANLYPYLQNRSLASGSTTNKPLLPAEAYTIASSSPKVTVSTDANGLYAKANEEIKTSEGIQVTIMILDNTGSSYSKVDLTVTTETVAAGGGTGGGTGTPPPAAETHKPYINGYSDRTFRAENPVTREEVAKMLIAALQEEKEENAAYTSYSDVAASRWSAAYIERARKLGYLLGDPDGTFRPAAPMTRAELSACLVRAAKALGKDVEEGKSFPDVADTAWFAPYVEDAAALGLVTGYPDGTFRPQNDVTRAEAVTMVNRVLSRDPRTAAALQAMESPFTDTPVGQWDYLDIMEASMAHEH